MKTLIIINEPLANMALGRNSTLAYILSCVALKHEVFIYNLPNSLPQNRHDLIAAFHLTANKKLAEILVKTYQKTNQQIMRAVRENNLPKLSKLPLHKLDEFLPKKIALKSLPIKEFELVIQRLEPMKSPFPPVGKKNIDEFLQQLKKLFPHLIFNCPIGLSDKEIPQEINQILSKKIATPTAEFKLGENALESIKSMTQEYQKIYGKQKTKLVFKPKNSAQSLGVFAVEFVKNGTDFLTLKNQKIAQLKSAQIYQIKSGLDEKELKKIIEILCFIQNAKIDEDLQKLTQAQILKKAKKLFNDQILVQPFLEGVKFGDVRVNFLKDKKGNFYAAGTTFRKSLREEEKKFTTAYSNGGAASQPVELLQKSEIKNLHQKTSQILKILNGELRQKYQNSTELGADFILVGDGKNIFLGEINHHCQGLIPLSEAMAKAVDENAFYEGGLGLTRKAIEDLGLLQKK
jgi:ribosomal protein L22